LRGAVYDWVELYFLRRVASSLGVASIAASGEALLGVASIAASGEKQGSCLANQNNTSCFHLNVGQRRSFAFSPT
jgi:hypothetical protein